VCAQQVSNSPGGVSGLTMDMKRRVGSIYTRMRFLCENGLGRSISIKSSVSETRKWLECLRREPGQADHHIGLCIEWGRGGVR